MDTTDAVTREETLAFIGECRPHWLLLLRHGPNHGKDPVADGETALNHVAHMIALRAQRKMTLFGPLSGESDIAGVGVFTVATRDEAEALLARDPAIVAGYLVGEIHPWFSHPGESLPA